MALFYFIKSVYTVIGEYTFSVVIMSVKKGLNFAKKRRKVSSDVAREAIN